MLKKTEARQGVLFTIDYGAIPVWSIHLACESVYFFFRDKLYALLTVHPNRLQS